LDLLLHAKTDSSLISGEYISGAQYNPAVTIAVYIYKNYLTRSGSGNDRRYMWRYYTVYIIIQIMASVCAGKVAGYLLEGIF
jgi:glycerol uptake facilitator-like aquaporin